MPPVPNQRTIRIPNHQIVNEIIFDKSTLANAAVKLSNGGDFKLWCYLYSQSQNQDLLLSRVDFVRWSGVATSTYHASFNRLINAGFLVPTSRNNYYIFVDNPDKVSQATEVYEDETNKISVGERIIAQLLTDNNVPFIREATFGTCLFEDTKYPAKFDFWVQGRYLIEYDGEQHFGANGRGWNTEEQFEKTQKHDEYKSNWCKENHIPLIRIPYTKLDTLSIEDLLLETTQFKEN